MYTVIECLVRPSRFTDIIICLSSDSSPFPCSCFNASCILLAPTPPARLHFPQRLSTALVVDSSIIFVLLPPLFFSSSDKSRARTRRLFGLASSYPVIGDAELNSAVEFHVFEGIEDKKKFEAEYFEKIRSLDLSPEVNKKIAKEAK